MKFLLRFTLFFILITFTNADFAIDRSKLLVRKWNFTHVEIPALEEYLKKATTHEKVNLYNKLKQELSKSYINFKPDGKYEALVMHQGPVDGTWKLSANENNIIVQIADEKEAGELEIVTLSKKELVVLGAADATGKKVKMFLVPESN